MNIPAANPLVSNSAYRFRKKLASRTAGFHIPINWNTRAYTYSPWFKFGITLISVNIATLLTLYLRPMVDLNVMYLLYFGAIMFAAWFGGFRFGILSTSLSSIIAAYLFSTNAPLASSHFIIRFLIFLIEGGLVSLFIQTMHDAVKNYSIKNIELVRSEQRYRLVVETVTDYAIYTTDINGYITSWNTGAVNLHMYTSGEILGRHYSLLYPPEETAVGKPWKVLQEAARSNTFSTEGFQTTKSGKQFWASVVITPIFDEIGTTYGFSVIVRDLSERMEQEKRKDDFISIASHELKTPITSLKIFTQLLLRLTTQLPDKSSIKYLHKMDLQLDRLNHLVNDLLDVSHIQTGEINLNLEKVDMNELIHDTVDNVQEVYKEYDFVVKGAVKNPVYGDRDRLYQVLLNFLTNAIKYSPKSRKIVISLSQDGTRAIVAIQDFGIGIPINYKDKIFERFFRASHTENKFPGFGMGLFISSEIIKSHNGSVWVDTEPGKGSTFYFALPVKTS